MRLAMSSNNSLQTALAVFHTDRPSPYALHDRLQADAAVARHIEPLETIMGERDRPFSDRRPGPYLDAHFGVLSVVVGFKGRSFSHWYLLGLLTAPCRRD